ncbi:MAG: Calx-beta domain-containing protein, partial [Chloroflexota bacterium]
LWAIRTLDSVGDVGFQPAISVDRQGQPHMIYYDATRYKLKYAVYDRLSDGYLIETFLPAGNHPGFEAEIGLDLDDQPVVLALSSAGQQVIYAQKGENGWLSRTIEANRPSDGELWTLPRLTIDRLGLPIFAYVDEAAGQIAVETVDLPTVSVVQTGAYESVSGGQMPIGIQLDRPFVKPVTVTLALVTETATPDIDFQPIPTQTLVFLPGTTLVTVTLTLVDDAIPEENETIGILLRDPIYAEAIPQSTSVIIYDDETPIELSVAPLVQFENSGAFDLELVLNKPTLQEAEISLTLSSRIATVAEDYDPAVSIPIAFEVGDQVVTYSIPVIDDAIREPDETITVTLENPVNLNISTTIALATIKNDDGWESWTSVDPQNSNPIGESDIALDRFNRPHTVYRDMKRGHLVYAVYQPNTDLWITETLSAAGINGTVGVEPHLLIDGDNRPVIGYYQVDRQALEIARLTESGWVTQTAVSAALGQRFGMAFDAAGRVRIAYRSTSFGTLGMAIVDQNDVTLEEIGIGGEPDVGLTLAIDETGGLHVATVDQTANQLIYWENAGGGWTLSRVNLTGQPGIDLALDLDRWGQPHFSYFDSDQQHLGYGRRISGTWQIETVDQTSGVGLFSALRVTKENRPLITYFDWTNGDLMVATRVNGDWQIETAAGNQSDTLGYAPAMVLTWGDIPLISHADLTQRRLTVTHLPLPPFYNDDPIRPETHTLYLPYIKGYRHAPDLVISDVAVDLTDIEIVIENIGTAAITNSFWVDLYLNPIVLPSLPNQEWWQLGSEGLVWGVEAEAELNVGDQLTLTLSSESYRPDLGNFSGTFDPGDAIYIQVD